MQTGPCVGALGFTLTYPAPGGGAVMCDVEFTGDGVSLHQNGCDGDVTRLHTTNSSPNTAWVSLPDKKAGNKWITLPPGADIVTTSPGQLNNLGLSKASDLRSVKPVFVQPT